MLMAGLKDRISFRCSSRLRKKIDAAAKRSGVSVSDQARISLERLYEVEAIWLPPLLQKPEDGKPGSDAPIHGIGRAVTQRDETE